jgi:hypothetical protein
MLLGHDVDGCSQLTYLLQNSLSGNSKTLVSIRVLLFFVEGGRRCADTWADVPEPFAAGGPPQRVTLFTAFRYQGKYTKNLGLWEMLMLYAV